MQWLTRWRTSLSLNEDPQISHSADSEITVHLSRDDVHAGDTAAPSLLRLPGDAQPNDILQQAADPSWLPTVRDSVVAWSITSNVVLAVVEHDCKAGGTGIMLMQMDFLNERLQAADWDEEGLHLHFNYHPAQEAHVVFDTLRCIKLSRG